MHFRLFSILIFFFCCSIDLNVAAFSYSRYATWRGAIVAGISASGETGVRLPERCAGRRLSLFVRACSLCLSRPLSPLSTAIMYPLLFLFVILIFTSAQTCGGRRSSRSVNKAFPLGKALYDLRRLQQGRPLTGRLFPDASDICHPPTQPLAPPCYFVLVTGSYVRSFPFPAQPKLYFPVSNFVTISFRWCGK